MGEVLASVTRHEPTAVDVWRKVGVSPEELPQLVALTLAQIHHESGGSTTTTNGESGAAGLLQLLSGDLRDRARQLGGLDSARAQIQTYAETVRAVQRAHGFGLPEAAWRWASGAEAVKRSIKARKPQGVPPRLPHATVERQLKRYIVPMLGDTYRDYARFVSNKYGIAELPAVFDGTFRHAGREWHVGNADELGGAGGVLSGVSWVSVGAVAAVVAAAAIAVKNLGGR